jgi:hypothetical protein
MINEKDISSLLERIDFLMKDHERIIKEFQFLEKRVGDLEDKKIVSEKQLSKEELFEKLKRQLLDESAQRNKE